MAYTLLAILALAIVASLVAAYMSARTWPVYQAVLVAFVFLGLVAFFYLGARTLATHKAWRELVRNQKNELANLESQSLPLRGGFSPQGEAVQGEIPQLKHRLALLSRARGGVYENASADSLANDVVQLTLKPPRVQVPDEDAAGEPEPDAEPPAAETPPGAAAPPAGEQPSAPFVHGLVKDTALFAFDQKPVSDGGRYLGEFKVVEAAENSPVVKIAPNFPLTPEQRKRVETAVKGTWTLYTTMPADDATVFTSLDDARRQALLPPQSVQEFAKPDRALRDYQLFFRENYVQQSLLRDTIAKTTTNIERTVSATNEAMAEAKYREGEMSNLQADLEKFRLEVQAVTAYRKSLEQFLTDVRAKLKATYVANRQAATTLTRAQLDAEAEINQRTNADVQAAR